MILVLYPPYSDTKMILGEAVIKATVGVKQGSPTSCFLYVVQDLKWWLPKVDPLFIIDERHSSTIIYKRGLY